MTILQDYSCRLTETKPFLIHLVKLSIKALHIMCRLCKILIALWQDTMDGMQYKQRSILGPQRTQVQRDFRLRASVTDISLECKHRRPIPTDDT